LKAKSPHFKNEKDLKQNRGQENVIATDDEDFEELHHLQDK
jgi:hypothetical protein